MKDSQSQQRKKPHRLDEKKFKYGEKIIREIETLKKNHKDCLEGNWGWASRGRRETRVMVMVIVLYGCIKL